jgi:LacI family transcriptional regulator
MNRPPKVMLLPDSSREYARELLSGVARYSRLQSTWVIVRPPPFWERKKERASWDLIREERPDGVVMEEEPNMAPILKLGIPMVVSNCFNRLIPGAINVIGDHAAMGTMAAEHLIECGFKQFAFWGYDNMPWSQDRCHGFEQRLARSGFSAESFKDTAPEPPGKSILEQKALCRWLTGLPKPVGIMACNDERSQQLVEVCRVLSISVPDEIGVIGVDNDPIICELSSVPLSSIAIDVERAGFEAARHLAQLMRSRRRRDSGGKVVIQPTRVVRRQSTDLVNVNDPILQKAVRYIRAHGKGPLRVADVTAAAGASRRFLERRFKSAFDRSIQREIRRTRVSHIESYLAETDLSVTTIAERLGFPGFEHIARYFRAEKGLSPQAYRKKISYSRGRP